ncbi:cytochrome b [Luteimonas pelagia]
MTLRNVERWGPVSQVLHWTIALLVVVLAIVGLSLDSLPRSPDSLWVYDLHKSTGLTVLGLAVVRLAWRLYAGAPAPVPGVPRIERIGATTAHALLYVLIFAMPLSGWLMDSASGLRPLEWFGLFRVPKLASPDEALADDAHDLHETLFLVLLGVVALHVLAAFYHHLFRGDATLARMLPRGWLRGADPREADRG